MIYHGSGYNPGNTAVGKRINGSKLHHGDCPRDAMQDMEARAWIPCFRFLGAGSLLVRRRLVIPFASWVLRWQHQLLRIQVSSTPPNRRPCLKAYLATSCRSAAFHLQLRRALHSSDPTSAHRNLPQALAATKNGTVDLSLCPISYIHFLRRKVASMVAMRVTQPSAMYQK